MEKTTERLEAPSDQVRVRWRRVLDGDRGWPVHYLDVRTDGKVALWEQSNPRDTAGTDCTIEAFLTGELKDDAIVHVGREAYEEALAAARETG